jgi:methyltransferase (TIGR00027 family)
MHVSTKEIGDYFKPLQEYPDEEDYRLHRTNFASEHITERLCELVPLLRFVDFKVEEQEEKETVLSIPLFEEAMNQNGTQQASVFYLLADYTAGIAMLRALPGIYVTGIHDRCHAQPVQCWLKSGKVEHIAPGIGKVLSKASISDEQGANLRKLLIQKGHAELEVEVNIYEEARLVAKAHHLVGIYCDNPREPGKRANFFQSEDSKRSATLIAGLREDPLSKQVAGLQGIALANRFAVATPELPSLIKARTLHLESFLRDSQDRISQVVVLGVGLDVKPLKYASSKQHWYGLDLRAKHKERSKIFADLNLYSSYFTPVNADFRLDNWQADLLKTDFNPQKTTFFVIEGLTMYFTLNELLQLFNTLLSLILNAETQIWIDHVTKNLFEMEIPSVRSFLSSISRLGEPFLTGFSSPLDFLSPDHWKVTETVSAFDVLGEGNDVHQEYLFSLLCPIITR